MNRFLCVLILLLGACLAPATLAESESADAMQQFGKFDPSSTHNIKYADLDAFLRALVVDLGRSNREKAAPEHAKTGTRMRIPVSLPRFAATICTRAQQRPRDGPPFGRGPILRCQRGGRRSA